MELLKSIFSNCRQELKAFPLMLILLFSISNFFIEEAKKAYLPIEVTLCGILIFVNFCVQLNALSPIVSKPSGS